MFPCWNRRQADPLLRSDDIQPGLDQGARPSLSPPPHTTKRSSCPEGAVATAPPQVPVSSPCLTGSPDGVSATDKSESERDAPRQQTASTLLSPNKERKLHDMAQRVAEELKTLTQLKVPAHLRSVVTRRGIERINANVLCICDWPTFTPTCWMF